MKKATILLTVLVTCFITHCFAQTEEAILYFNDGTSVPGYARIKNNRIKFRVSLDSKADFWGYEMIEKVEFETFFGPKIFRYIKVNDINNPILMEIVTEGHVSLYRKRKITWGHESLATPIGIPDHIKKTEKNTNFLIREGEDFPSCLNCDFLNRWKKRTIDFLSNCPGLVEKIKTGVYGEDDLKDIVEYYNDFCADH